MTKKELAQIKNYNRARLLCKKLGLNISELARNSTTHLQSAILDILEKLMKE
jgi:hypothetical protein